MTAVVRGLVALLVAWIGLAPATTAEVAQAAPLMTYAYDGQHHPLSQILTSTERGPPRLPEHDTPHYAVDHELRGTTARPDIGAPPATNTYDQPALVMQLAVAATMTDADGQVTLTAFSPLTGERVAAKNVDNLPTVNWGQQSKHFPGHPNYIPGRSQLTANPEALIQRAGTGTPVGSVPRGQPGFKERIDFGDSIGSYVSRDGASSPTSIGILHYRADGSVHIIPGRPW